MPRTASDQSGRGLENVQMLELDLTEARVMGRPLAIHLAVSSLRVIEVYRGVLGNIHRIVTIAAVADALSESGAAEASVDGSTIAAVAARSGADKETVRRRVLQLVEDGILRRSRNGRVRLDPGFVRRPTFLGAMRRHVEQR